MTKLAMPPATTLNFYRKRQTFAALASERPQSLQSVYTIVREVVSSVETRLLNLETSYYEPNGKMEAEIKQWQIPLQLLLRPARQSGLHSLGQLNELAERQLDPTDVLTIDEHSLNLIQSLVNKALKATRVGFSESIFFVEKLLEYMSRYCLSFSPLDGDAYLETATNYEKQRRDLANAIRRNLQNITLMADKFEKETLHVQHFDISMKEMAERLRIDHSPIAIMFPTACQNLRNACKGLLMWVEADMTYSQYLRYDITELEKKKEMQMKFYRDSQLKASGQEFNVKSLQKIVSECDEEMKKLKPKEVTLQEEEKKLREENKDVLEDLTIKEYRKMEMKINGLPGDRESQENYERLQSEIIELKVRKPAIERRVADLEKQRTFIHGRESFKLQKETELKLGLQELRQWRRVARKAEVELQRIESCLAKLKEIHLLKTSDETLKKIFHNLPVYSRNTRSWKKTKDRLQRLCHLVAQKVEGDWVRLYRSLPFFPPRGEETTTADIGEIMSRFMRNTEEQANQALTRWRRMHIRASIDDLKTALTAIKRTDIIERFERRTATTISREKTMSAKIQKVVHFPKLPPSRKKQHYLQF
ncbi:uncharacterized protein LOC106070508 isoform X2 [Biomphalaria glabrata]|nr:uncharacterized protein LOC106070508 isoform X2 [Biomphalaria glabrata]XP_013085884.2 uncharacterized protein LOC106070508 isoform X2 [Biomphalaria glabrata]XP_013085886.2 uncharacterized protein LOC106070508 isoform X2 [Biomphalaria glabrata]XP_055888334.1 uncharacterized protein LOC106070508 isoform X2 [Biomphalaria glabrata]